MKLRKQWYVRLGAALLAASLLTPAYSAWAEYVSVSATSGDVERKDIGDIDGQLYVYASGDNTATVEVGNVTQDADRTAVTVGRGSGNVDLKIKSVDAVDGLVIGADNGAEQNIHVEENIVTEITGDPGARVGATALYVSVNHADSLNIDIDGRVQSDSYGDNSYSNGMELYFSGKEMEVTVGDGIEVTADASASGISMPSFEGTKSKVTIENGGISAETRNKGGWFSQAEALNVNAFKDAEAEVIIENGDITAKGETSKTHHSGSYHNTVQAISLWAAEGATNSVTLKDGDVVSDGGGIEFRNGGGEITVSVEKGDVNAKDIAVMAYTSDSYDVVGTNELIVDGTISSEKQAILVDERQTEESVKITVWKIEQGEDGDMVKQYTKNASYAQPEETDVSRAIEENIAYIIRIDKEVENGSISVEGTRDSNGYMTAREGEKILVKVVEADGYQLKQATNGVDKDYILEKDEDGNYYLIIPKGGGVFLSAILEKIVPPEPEPEPEPQPQPEPEPEPQPQPEPEPEPEPEPQPEPAPAPEPQPAPAKPQVGYQLGMAYAPDGNDSFAIAFALIYDGKIADASIDSFGFIKEGTGEGVPGSDSEFGKNFAEGQILASAAANNTEKAEALKAAADKAKVMTISQLREAGAEDAYLAAIAKAAESAEAAPMYSYSGDRSKVSAKTMLGTAGGPDAFTVTAAVTDGSKIITALVDDICFMSGADVKGMPNSNSDLAHGCADGQKLASRRENAELYKAVMEEKTGEARSIADSFSAIRKAVSGKSIEEVKTLAQKDDVAETTGVYLPETGAYLAEIAEAAEK